MKAADELPGHDLHRPDDLQCPERDDPPLAFVQERRRSIRRYAAQPITEEQLGEFLYRVARVTNQWQSDVATPTGNPERERSLEPSKFSDRSASIFGTSGAS
ncbi:MAG TPA: hypothetical protein VND64_23680 [Pirellulales bacterium]|nr:hypothetical protein [Pirellulales bacterium]